MSSPMENEIRRYLGKGATYMIDRKRDMNYSAQRDIGNCFFFICAEAISQTQLEVASEEDAAIVDTIANYMKLIYTGGSVDNKEALAKMAELYNYIDQEPRRCQLYSTFSLQFVQAQIAWMYTSMDMALGLGNNLADGICSYTSTVSLMSKLPDSLRKQVLDVLKDIGEIPENVDIDSLKRRNESFLSIIEEDQARRRKEFFAKQDANG